MKVLVTGANGFLGLALVKQLVNSGYSVRGLMRNKHRDSDLRGLNIEVVKGDILNPQDLEKAMEGCKIIFHLASLYTFYPWWQRKAAMLYKTNVEGTRNLLTTALRNQAERFIFTSSIASLVPASSHYARSKAQAEEEVLKFCQKGLPALILSPAIIFGERDYKPTPSGEIILNFLKRRYPGYFDARLAVADVEDVARAHIAALENGRIGQNYILADNQAYSLKEVFRLLEEISGVKAPLKKIPYRLLLTFAYLEEIITPNRKPLIPSEGIKFCKMLGKFDNTNAAKDLGYTATPLKQTLQRAVNWYRENGYLKDA